LIGRYGSSAPRHRRARGGHEASASERAIDEVAARVEAILARDGPSAIAVYSGTHGLFGVCRGDILRIESDHDFIYGIAEESDEVLPGVVSMAHARDGVPGAGSTNRLVTTDRDFEPVSGIPRQSAIAVRIRPLTEPERAAIGAGTG
jgi:hypothetical protein